MRWMVQALNSVAGDGSARRRGGGTLGGGWWLWWQQTRSIVLLWRSWWLMESPSSMVGSPIHLHPKHANVYGPNVPASCEKDNVSYRRKSKQRNSNRGPFSISAVYEVRLRARIAYSQYLSCCVHQHFAVFAWTCIASTLPRSIFCTCG